MIAMAIAKGLAYGSALRATSRQSPTFRGGADMAGLLTDICGGFKMRRHDRHGKVTPCGTA
jgi:hypothetical protein